MRELKNVMRVAGLCASLALGCGSSAESAGAASDAAAADAGGGGGTVAAGLGPLQVSVQAGQVTFSWPEDEWPHHCVVITQQLAGAGKPTELTLCTKTSGQGTVTLGAEAGKNGADYAFSATVGLQVGPATWALRGGDKYWGVTPVTVATGTTKLGPHFGGPCQTQTTTMTGLQEWYAKPPVTVNVAVTLGEAARDTVDITTPEIWVDSAKTSGSTASGGTLQFSYTFDTPGMYTVEVNNTGGGAILNCGVYVGADVPLVPVEKTGGAGLSAPPTQAQLDSFRKKLLDLTNAERAKVKLGPLALNDTLHKMAQYHSEDMGAKDYFAHTSPSGESVGDRAAKFGWSKGIGENIASHPSIEGAHSGLYWSAGHRANMLGKWSVVGFGIAKAAKGNNMIVTENFGE